MYRITDIQNALLHVVGWEQSYDPRKTINEDMTQSESGLYFQQSHPLMTLDNIQSIMPDDWNLQYPAWNMVLTYRAGQRVIHDGIVWIAKKDNRGEEPNAGDFNGDFSQDFGNPYWQPYNPVTHYLERITRAGISTAIQTFIQSKQLEHETRNLLERKTFFDGAGRIKNTIQNRQKIVGFEIVPARTMGVTAKIEKIGLQMTGATGMVRLYLFHSSQLTPIQTYDLEFTQENGGFQWFDLKDCYMPYMGKNTNAGGAWYLVYDQNQLPMGMEAINVSKDWSREPCGTCNIGSVETWREIIKYVQISPFMVEVEDFTRTPLLWDITQNVYTNTQSYGMNCEITVGCDLTDFIISQREIFKTVIQRQVATTALRTMAMNPNVRVNRNQTNVSRMEMLYEIDGNTTGRPGGLAYELSKAYKALRLDTVGLDRICLSCNNHGVKYRTV